MRVIYFDSVVSTAEPVLQTLNPPRERLVMLRIRRSQNRNDDESAQRLRRALYTWNTTLCAFIVVSGIDGVIDEQQESKKPVKHSEKSMACFNS